MATILYLVSLYLINIAIKASICTMQIHCGNQLKKQLYLCSENRSAVTQLYAKINGYCEAADIKPLANPYGIKDTFLNKANKQVQKQLFFALDEAIGVYRFRRSYCYILFTVQKNNKSGSAFKIFIDAIIKIATAVIAELLKLMISN